MLLYNNVAELRQFLGAHLRPGADTKCVNAREVLLEVLHGEGFARLDPQPMFPNPPGLLRLEPFSEGLRDRIWWGAGTPPSPTSSSSKSPKTTPSPEAETLLLTVPNRLGVAYNALVIEAILKHVVSALGWRRRQRPRAR